MHPQFTAGTRGGGVQGGGVWVVWPWVWPLCETLISRAPAHKLNVFNLRITM